MQGFGVNWSDLWKDLIPVLFHWYRNHHRMASHSKLKGWWITQYNSHFNLANFHPIISHQQSRLHHQVFENFRFPTHRFCLSRPSGWLMIISCNQRTTRRWRLNLMMSSWCPYVVAWPFLLPSLVDLNRIVMDTLLKQSWFSGKWPWNISTTYFSICPFSICFNTHLNIGLKMARTYRRMKDQGGQELLKSLPITIYSYRVQDT